MALLFGGASTDVVNAGDGVALRNLTTATYIHWVYLNGGTPAFQILQRKGTYGGAVSARDFYIANGVTLQCAVARASANLQGVALLSNFAAYGTGKWLYVVGVHDTGGAAGAQKLYIGDLTTRAAEPSAYATQTVGSGALGDNTTQNQFIGDVASGSPILGRLAVTLMFNRVLTLAELHSIQFRPRPLSGCVGYWIFGNTTGTQTDYSGNANAGTVTGATVADHIPQPSAFAFDFPAGETASQTIAPAGLIAEERVGSQAVSPGAVTVTPAGIPTSATSGTAVASLSVTPTGVPPVEALGITITAPGAATISPTGIPSNEQGGTATVTPGAVAITPAGIPTSADNGIAAVTPSITVAGLLTTEALGAQTITIDVPVLLVGVDMLHSVLDRARYAHAVSDEG